MRSFLFCCLVLVPLAAVAQAPAGSRGELLYSTHCIECHTVQMHWRALRLARDWDSLKVQVRRWQGEARLNWTEEDVDAVARHLNDTIYQFPRPLASRGPLPLRNR
jgi:mono/diheme cytochrome c family protein